MIYDPSDLFEVQQRIQKLRLTVEQVCFNLLLMDFENDELRQTLLETIDTLEKLIRGHYEARNFKIKAKLKQEFYELLSEFKNAVENIGKLIRDKHDSSTQRT